MKLEKFHMLQMATFPLHGTCSTWLFLLCQFRFVHGSFEPDIHTAALTVMRCRHRAQPQIVRLWGRL
jgi:hypothetical protein